MSTFVVTPRHEDLGGDLIVFVTDNFPNEGELSLSDLIPDRGNVEESCADLFVRDSFVNHLCDGDAKDFPYVAMKKYF